MAWVFGGKKFGQYTYEHWFDEEEHEDLKPKDPEVAPAEGSPVEESPGENKAEEKNDDPV